MNKTKFKQTEIEKIPEDWEVKKLGDFTKVQNGFAFKSSDFKAKGIPIIKIKNITPPTITFEEVQYYNEDIDDKLKPFILQKGDVIISMTGSNVNQMASAVGKVARYKSDLSALLNQRTGKIIIDSNIADSDYIYFYIARKEIQYYLAINASGSANQANISPDTIKSIPIALPSLSEQRVIAKILSDLDEKIELNQRMNKTLVAIAQAIFKHWFVNYEFPDENGGHYKSNGGEMVDSEIGPIPKGWIIKKLGNLLSKIVTGNRPKGGVSKYKKGIPSIGAESINGLCYYDFSKTKYIPESYFYNMKKGIVKNEDILLYKDGAKLGRKSMFLEDFPFRRCCVNSHVFILRSNSLMKQSYLFFYLDQEFMTKNIINLNTNSAQPGINSTSVKTLKILLPSDKILNLFNELVFPILRIMFNNAKENKSLSNLRDTLIPKLMSGEIRVPINNREGDE